MRSQFETIGLTFLSKLLWPFDILIKLMLLPAMVFSALGIPVLGNLYLWPLVKLGLIDEIVYDTL